jgi:hypothetical protein
MYVMAMGWKYASAPLGLSQELLCHTFFPVHLWDSRRGTQSTTDCSRTTLISSEHPSFCGDVFPSFVRQQSASILQGVPQSSEGIK